MAGVRVDRLDLRLKTPEPLRDRASHLRMFTESEFMPAVLRAMHRRLRSRYGAAAVVRIRRLSFNCTMKADALADADFVEVLADDLAAGVAATIVRDSGGGALPSPSAAAQVYRDRAHATAAALIAAAERREGPDGVREDFAALWRDVLGESPAALARILSRCDLAAKLAPVLARLDLPALIALEKRVMSAPAPVRAAIHKARIEKARQTACAKPRTQRSAPPAPDERTPPADIAATDEATVADDIATVPNARRDRSGKRTQRRASDPVVEATEPEGKPREEMPDSAPAAPQSPSIEPNDTPPNAPVKSAKDFEPTHETSEPGPAEDFAEIDAPSAIPADWCGLLYLVNVAQRLDFAERLWQAGVEEGAALSAMLRVLARDDDDPVTRILSPTFPNAPKALPPLADWAREELTTGLTAAAAALVARTTDRAAIEARIAAIAAWFAADGFPGWAAACHLAVFEAMTGEPVAPGALDEQFRRSGLIEIDGGVIRIVQPIDGIDTIVRYAGLDADPGWLAWLAKSLVFVFDDGAA